MDFVIIYRALLKKKWVILGVTFFAMLLAFLLTINYKPTYESTAQLATGFTVAEQVSVSNEKFNLFEADVKFNNLIETINSPKVFSMLSYKLLLHDINGDEVPFRTIENREKYNEVLAGTDVAKIARYTKIKLDSMELLSNYDEKDERLKDLLRLYRYNPSALREVINVSRVRGTDYVTIETYTEDPELSAFIANTLVDVFLEYNISIKSQRTSESAETFASLVKQKRMEMEQKSEELKQFKSSNRVLNFQMESSSIIEQLSELENQRNEHRRKVEGLQYELNDLSDRIKNSSNATVNTSNSEMNAEILQLREKISNLNGRFIATGSNNIELLDSLKILRASLQQKLINMGSGTTSNAAMDELMKKRQDKQVELEIARKDLNSIERNLRILRGSAGGYASKEATIAALERELKMATDEYQTAQEKYSQALDISLASGSNIRQTLEAQPADKPEPSKRLIITALAGASSFVLSIIFIVFIEYMDISIKSPSNFKRLTGLKLLGTLLSIDLNKSKLTASLKVNPPPKKLVQFNELLRKLRYEIEDQGAKKILVTSTQPQQGKTTFILALAAALTNVRRRVLIVDSNFSNNELTRVLKGRPTLENLSDKREDLKKSITKSEYENIFLLGCKGGNYSPSEVLNREVFFDNLESVKDDFDYIIMESAGLNTYADTKELEKYSDGVVGIFSAESVLRQIDQDSINYLTSLDEKFIGAILNEVQTANLDQ